LNEKPKFQKNVTDEMVAQYMEPYNQYFMSKTVQGKKPLITSGSSIGSNKENSKKSSKQNHNGFNLTNQEKSYLQSIWNNPNLNMTERGNQFGHTTDKNNKIKESLLNKTLVEEFTISFKKRTSKFLGLTDKGYLAIGKQTPVEKTYCTSVEHYWWQLNIAGFYIKKGIQVEIEKMVGNTRADVALMNNDGEMIAMEVELSAVNCCSNVRKDLDAGYIQVIEAVKNNKLKKDIEDKLRKNFSPTELKKVKTMTLNEFPFVADIMGTNKK
jgi:hypothetical protein